MTDLNISKDDIRKLSKTKREELRTALNTLTEQAKQGINNINSVDHEEAQAAAWAERTSQLEDHIISLLSTDNMAKSALIFPGRDTEMCELDDHPVFMTEFEAIAIIIEHLTSIKLRLEELKLHSMGKMMRDPHYYNTVHIFFDDVPTERPIPLREPYHTAGQGQRIHAKLLASDVFAATTTAST